MSTVHRTWKTFACSLIASRPSNCQLSLVLLNTFGLHPNPAQRGVVPYVDEKKPDTGPRTHAVASGDALQGNASASCSEIAGLTRDRYAASCSGRDPNAAQQHMNASIAVANAGLANLLDPLLEGGLSEATRLVAVDVSTRNTRQARRIDTSQSPRISSTSLRLRTGFKAFGGGRPEASPCRGSNRPPPRLTANICYRHAVSTLLKKNAFWASENLGAFIALRSSQPGNHSGKLYPKTVEDSGLRPRWRVGRRSEAGSRRSRSSGLREHEVGH
jgi:hypothetical protein